MTTLSPRLPTPRPASSNRLLCAAFHRIVLAGHVLRRDRPLLPTRSTLCAALRSVFSPASPIAAASLGPTSHPHPWHTAAPVALDILSQRGSAAIPSCPRAALHRAACDNGLAA
ncbi:hypothetical protein TPAR_01762 [Tolypocladium paradoxum]|uniref:Uncharacterized protein n=1 Tax=Tolypocladium paradoxum TaxID=94208 RepID=A0A2S4L6L1_9HYPO|nr:hypothetical protein TPAR_01762 [Tolypocladium paradoxum]